MENTWSFAMNKIMWKMTWPPSGHIAVQEVVRKEDWLGHSKVKVKTVLEQNRQHLRVDTFGCLVVNVV